MTSSSQDLPMSSPAVADSSHQPEARQASCGPILLVLGPVTLRDEAGGEVALGGTRPRRLLAGLAVHAGEAVSADRLADMVWGERPPRSARANLHTYLWSLRRCLAAAVGNQAPIRTQAAIEICPGGYMLRVGPGVLDWHRFRDLAATAAGIAGSDPAAAAALLRQALSLWRGPAAADLDGEPPALAARIAAMGEARMIALEQRVEAELAAGRHRELAPELAELTSAHPLREQFRAHQMLALYRSGRQADALAAFHQLRDDLADELGIDPSPPLQALHQAILRADPLIGSPPALAADRAGPGQEAAAGTAPAGSPGVTVPDLPPEVTLGQRAATEEARLFQGRRAELDRMLNLLAAPSGLPRVVQVHGPAGIGKTAFAYALARECARRGWPAVVLDSRDFRHDASGLTETMTARSAGTWSPRCGRPLLLVLDTVEEMRDMEHQLWGAVLPRITGPVLVVLSGRRPTPIFARPAGWHGLVDELELRGLPEPESRQLARLHGIRDPGAIAEILAFACGNPLFLTVAAHHARSAAGYRPLDLPAVVSRSLIGRMTREITDPAVRRLLEAASLVRTFNQELLVAMLGGAVSDSFDTLRGLGVVREVTVGLRLHDLVREAVAADFCWRAPRTCHQMRQRAYHYIAVRARSATDAEPHIQELLHLAAGSSARARFYAPAGDMDVHVRPVSWDDLPRLTELCHTGITRFGMPPAERARQLRTDFPVAPQHFAVALNEAGAITGFAYTVRLNRDTWRTAARTREAFFDSLPEPELADIMATPPAASRSGIVTGATHLPGYDHVSAALKLALFPKALKRQSLSGHYCTYHLLTRDCPEIPVITAAGLTRRSTDIELNGWRADEWLLRFGDGGFIGWIGEILGVGTAPPAPADGVRA